MLAQIEDGQRAGAGMGADDCAHIVDHNVLDTVLFLCQLFQILGILDAVAVADEDGVVFTGKTGLTQLLCQSLDRGLSASYRGGWA